MEISKNHRIVILDSIRGFAILGIFLVNMFHFHSPYLYLEPFSLWESSTDQTLYKIIHVLAEGSFYPLFSLLFGYGLVLLMEKTMTRGLNFNVLATRRLTVLLVFGMIHAFLIWHGDILMTYAVIGFLFLLFLRMPAKGMFLTGGLTAVSVNLLVVLMMAVSLLIVPQEEMAAIVYSEETAEQAVYAYQEGSFTEISKQRFKDWFMVNNPLNGFMLIFMILPYFLIGGGAAKLKWMERIDELKRPFAIAFALTFTLGLFLKLVPFLFVYNFATYQLAYGFGGPLLAIAYALGFALLSRTGVNKILAVLAPVGRMSLSNYIMQSIIATFIFYSFGLGLFGKVSLLTGTLIVIVIYGLQIIVSTVWMKYFHYGPLEWLWRTATYWKKQPFRMVKRGQLEISE